MKPDDRTEEELRLAVLDKELRERTGEVADLERQLAALREDLAAARQLAAENVRREVEAASERFSRSAQAEAAAIDELAALRATKLFRWSSKPRQLYGRFRSLLG